MLKPYRRTSFAFRLGYHCGQCAFWACVGALVLLAHFLLTGKAP